MITLKKNLVDYLTHYAVGNVDTVPQITKSIVGEFANQSFILSPDYQWTIVRTSDKLLLLPLKKETTCPDQKVQKIESTQNENL